MQFQRAAIDGIEEDGPEVLKELAVVIADISSTLFLVVCKARRQMIDPKRGRIETLRLLVSIAGPPSTPNGEVH
jgi:hypothetical protein